MTPWQTDVREFHIRLGLETGNYIAPRPLTGDTLALRARLIEEEAQELADAKNANDLIEIIDALIDLAYVTAGSFDVAGIPAHPRYWEIIQTGGYHASARSGHWYTTAVTNALNAVLKSARTATAAMWRDHNAGWGFQRFDMLNDLLKKIAHAFTAMRIDPRPFFDEVHRSNLAKAGGPIIAGKQRKPVGWTPPDIAGVLRGQGVL